MRKLDVYPYFVLMKNMWKTLKELCILSCKKSIFQTLILLNIRKSKNIHDELPIEKPATMHRIETLMSLFNGKRNHCYYKVFSEKNCIANIKMLYCNRIDVSEGIDINNTGASKECNIFHYWDFIDKGFKFQSFVCTYFNDVLMMSVNLNDIATFTILGVDY